MSDEAKPKLHITFPTAAVDWSKGAPVAHAWTGEDGKRRMGFHDMDTGEWVEALVRDDDDSEEP